ncbi:MAG: hypothetical protein IPI61_08380 [Syntrophaceae bacterium]|nr:hypothetical protein [Syntrophaceae bacterium]
MNTIPLRLDWLWFLGYDLDSEIPNHSVLSKARGAGVWRPSGASSSALCGSASKRAWWTARSSLWIRASSRPMPRTTRGQPACFRALPGEGLPGAGGPPG